MALPKTKMIKIAIDSGPLLRGDFVRGIGLHTKLLIDYLSKIKDIEFDVIDVQKEDVSKYDIIHYQKFNPYLLSIPILKKGKSILTIHDLIYLVYPKAYPSGIRGKLTYWLQKALVKKMDAIITISETSKKDIIRFLGISAEKITVIYLAAEENFKKIDNKYLLNAVKEKYHLPSQFVLNVGDINYNKNILTLARACKKAKIPLVLVGKQAAEKDFDRTHPENQPLVKVLSEFGKDRNIVRLGYVPDDELLVIYNLATLYSQPSYYEGFGLSIIKAFACELPVVASKIQAHVEVAHEACLYADPKDPADFAEKIKLVLNDTSLRKELIAKGLAKAKEYSWAKVAKETADVYKKVSQQH